MINVPVAIGIGNKIVSAKGIALGLAQNFSIPLACTTGYRGTELRKGSNVSAGKPLNLEAGCTTKNPKANVRGPKSVPALNQAARSAVSSPNSLGELMGGGQ